MIIELKDINIVSDNRRLIPIIVKGRPRSVTSSEYKKCKNDMIKIVKSQLPEWWETISDAINVKINVQTYKAFHLFQRSRYYLDLYNKSM